jgi:hypothetical protein
MKRTTSPAEPAIRDAFRSSQSTQALSRIGLEFLGDYVCEKRGYDPYDTSRGRAPDIWAAKRKRA